MGALFLLSFILILFIILNALPEKMEDEIKILKLNNKQEEKKKNGKRRKKKTKI